MLAHRLVSYPTTRIGNWLVRGSIYRNDSICMVAFNSKTNETQVRYFLDEEEAFKYVRQLS